MILDDVFAAAHFIFLLRFVCAAELLQCCRSIGSFSVDVSQEDSRRCFHSAVPRWTQPIGKKIKTMSVFNIVKLL